MWRPFLASVCVALLASLMTGRARAAGPASAPAGAPILQRFLSIDDPAPTQYRVLRHLNARNEHFDSSAWMDVWTEADQTSGLRYRIVGQGGSEHIRKRVFLAMLEAEQTMWASGAFDRAAVTPDNYIFEDRGAQPVGLTSLGVKPRRRDVLLVEGSIFLRPEDGDLVRMEGRLSKPPSFWTRRVEIVRRYRRFVGVRMPVALELEANLLVAGRATLCISYEYESVNGQRVGDPQPLGANGSCATPYGRSETNF